MTEDENVVLPHQAEIQVYFNESGGVTIRQCSPDPCDEDAFVSFSAEDAGKVSEAILATAKAIISGAS